MKSRVALVLVGLLGIPGAICGELHAEPPAPGTDWLGPLVEMSVYEPGAPPQESGVHFGQFDAAGSELPPDVPRHAEPTATHVGTLTVGERSPENYFALHAPQGATVVMRPDDMPPMMMLPAGSNPAGAVLPTESLPSLASRSAGEAFGGPCQPVAAWQPAEADEAPYQPLPPGPSGPQAIGPYQPLGPAAIGPRAATTEELLLLQELATDGQDRSLLERLRQYEWTDVTEEGWTHTVSGRVITDWVNWADDSQFGFEMNDDPTPQAVHVGQRNYFEFRRLRLSVSGTGYGVYDYKLQLEFAPEVDLEAPVTGASVVDDQVVGGEVNLGDFGIELKDAYLGIHDIPYLGYLRFGHFKAPFSLSELTGSRFVTFMERSLPHIFAPGREVGMAAYNHSVSQRLTWAYGAFFEEMEEMEHAIEDDNQGVRLVGRVTWTPHYDELSEGRYLLHTGLGYVYTRPRRRDIRQLDESLYSGRFVRFRSRPEIHRGDRLIDTRVDDDDAIDGNEDLDAEQYQMLDAELAWVHGPLSIQSELFWTGVDDVTRGRVNLYGAYAYASYFLTGEHRPYDRLDGTFGRVTPYENFWIVNTPRGCRSGWGAWELAARWSCLNFAEIQGQQLNDLTLGVNWYWNPYAKLMFNWIHPFAHNSPAADPPGLVNADGDVFAMRLQVDF
ncbi:MAG TPA: porin [Thermoguttaceae bacterium]|nr:porin [Thermoguttaceae bacterium]